MLIKIDVKKTLKSQPNNEWGLLTDGLSQKINFLLSEELNFNPFETGKYFFSLKYRHCFVSLKCFVCENSMGDLEMIWNVWESCGDI